MAFCLAAETRVNVDKDIFLSASTRACNDNGRRIDTLSAFTLATWVIYKRLYDYLKSNNKKLDTTIGLN